ncbi:MAG: hypothetical protein OXU42_13065 [Deltaproteobacteria bacterium]|nr:hypothetical protein [Deltaproteobacteria bacterium]
MELDWAETHKCRKPSQKGAMGEKVLQSQTVSIFTGCASEKTVPWLRNGFVYTTAPAKHRLPTQRPDDRPNWPPAVEAGTSWNEFFQQLLLHEPPNLPQGRIAVPSPKSIL